MTFYSSTGPVITHCPHGLDMRLHPRCYLCRPLADLPPLVDPNRPGGPACHCLPWTYNTDVRPFCPIHNPHLVILTS